MNDDHIQHPARRSGLVVPAKADAQLRGAGRFQADEIVLDLAGLDPAHKDTARAAVADALGDTDYGERLIAVRVNAIDTMWAYRDVVDIVERVGEFVDCIVVPRVGSPGDVEFVDTLIGMIEQRLDLAHRIGIEAEIGSAPGVALLDEIALSSDRLEALVLDEAGVASSLGAHRDATSDRWQAVRLRVLVSARAAELQAIVAPDVAGSDSDAYGTTVASARSLGFDGARCTHPTQVDAANRIFGDV